MPYADIDQRRAAHRRSYRRHAEKSRISKARRRKRVRAELRKIADDAREVACADCGREFPIICMDFDHVRGKKIKNVSDMVRRCARKEDLLEEISKCDVVCANCHRIRTWPTEDPIAA